MEVLNEEKRYPTLKLFCDWVVHSKLSGPKVQKLLAQMDELYDTRYLRNIPTQNDTPPLARDFLSWHGFKTELKAFLLKDCGVGTPAALDKRKWEHFEEVYSSIVRDCLLAYENKKKPLKHIDSAVVTILKPQFSPAQLRYDPLTVPTGIEWIFLKNGKETFRLLLTWGSKVALRDALPPHSGPETPTLPPH